jgi:hypothetical protein
MDNLRQEVEHSVFMVPARNKQAAIKSLKTGKAYRKDLLLTTPISEIVKRRRYWIKEVTRLRELERLKSEMPRNS